MKNLFYTIYIPFFLLVSCSQNRMQPGETTNKDTTPYSFSLDTTNISAVMAYNRQFTINMEHDFECNKCFSKYDSIQVIPVVDKSGNKFTCFKISYPDTMAITRILKAPRFSYHRHSRTEAPEYFYLSFNPSNIVNFVFYEKEPDSTEAEWLIKNPPDRLSLSPR